MTTAESRALYTLASFLLGPCEQEKRHHLVPLVSQEEALAALEYLVSRKSPTGGVYSHGTAELREKWNAKFEQVEPAKKTGLFHVVWAIHPLDSRKYRLLWITDVSTNNGRPASSDILAIVRIANEMQQDIQHVVVSAENEEDAIKVVMRNYEGDWTK